MDSHKKKNLIYPEIPGNISFIDIRRGKTLIKIYYISDYHKKQYYPVKGWGASSIIRLIFNTIRMLEMPLRKRWKFTGRAKWKSTFPICMEILVNVMIDLTAVFIESDEGIRRTNYIHLFVLFQSFLKSLCCMDWQQGRLKFTSILCESFQFRNRIVIAIVSWLFHSDILIFNRTLIVVGIREMNWLKLLTFSKFSSYESCWGAGGSVWSTLH